MSGALCPACWAPLSLSREWLFDWDWDHLSFWSMLHDPCTLKLQRGSPSINVCCSPAAVSVSELWPGAQWCYSLHEPEPVRWLREVSLPSWHPSPDVSCQASLIFSIASLCQSSVQSVISMSKSEYWYNHQLPSFTSHCSGFTVYCFTKVTFDFTPSSLRTSYIVND